MRIRATYPFWQHRQGSQTGLLLVTWDEAMHWLVRVSEFRVSLNLTNSTGSSWTGDFTLPAGDYRSPPGHIFADEFDVATYGAGGIFDYSTPMGIPSSSGPADSLVIDTIKTGLVCVYADGNDFQTPTLDLFGISLSVTGLASNNIQVGNFSGATSSIDLNLEGYAYPFSPFTPTNRSTVQNFKANPSFPGSFTGSITISPSFGSGSFWPYSDGVAARWDAATGACLVTKEVLHGNDYLP